ncbi:RNB-domain-containing protein [Colletotrichum sp. SAR11_59]|nr:RNB-domain-containing protein [Colletotrichum sp. SAR11_59]
MPTRSTFCNEILSENISIPPYSRQHLTDAGNEKKLHPPSDSTNNIRMVKNVVALAESVLTDKSAAFFRFPSVRKAIRARYRSIDIPRGKDRATFLYNEAGVSWIAVYHMVQLVVAMMNEVAQPNTEHCWTIQTMMERQISYVTQDVNTNVRTRVEKPLLGRVSRTAKPDITFAFGTLNSRAGSIYDQQVLMYDRTDFPKFGFLELKDHHIDIAEIRDLVKNPNRGFPVNSNI